MSTASITANDIQPTNNSLVDGSLGEQLQRPGARWAVLDLCCGIGGISVAARSLGFDVIAGVDVSLEALATFKHNFPAADVKRIDVTNHSEFAQCRRVFDECTAERKMIVSGPPCQGFSAAGARVLRDPRNRVLSSVAKAIVAIGPDAAIVENVANLRSTKHRRALQRFRSSLRTGGYSSVALNLNAADFGVPQVRHRTIIFVTRRPVAQDVIERHLATQFRPAPTVEKAFSGLDVPEVYGTESPTRSVRVKNHVAMRHSQAVMDKISQIQPGFGPMSYRRLRPDAPSRTLISGHRAPPAHFAQPRSITVREAARLQGFDDSFEILGSFSNQMQLVANAVPPPMAQAAIRALLLALGDNPT